MWERVNVANLVIPAEAGIHHQAQCKAVCSHLYGNGRFNYSNSWVRESIRGSEYPGRFLLPAFAGTSLAGMTKRRQERQRGDGKTLSSPLRGVDIRRNNLGGVVLQGLIRR